MKKKEFLEDSIGLIDEKLIAEANTRRQNRGRKILRYIAIAACMAIIISTIPIGLLIGKMQDPPSGEVMGSEITDETNAVADTVPKYDADGRELWVDDRKYKDGVEPYGAEMAYGWKWEYLDIFEKYWLIDFTGKEEPYTFANMQVTEEMLDEYLGEMVAYGYDDFGEGVRYEIACDTYSIKGAPDNDAIAVRLDGSDAYWIYRFIRRKNYERPQTLGELTTLKMLDETLPFESFYYDHDGDFRTPSVKYLVSPEQSKHIWNILIQKCMDAEAVNGDELFLGSSDIGFSATSLPLGVKNKSVSLYKDGYLMTNVMEYGDYFYVGKSVVNEIIEYMLSDPTEAPKATSKWVAGTITEIGEDYFKINDAPMMENEEDGIEFTVNTTDIKILRYFKSGILKVGDSAIVDYDGYIYADEPTVINGAYSINECQIIDGDAYIPE